MDLRALTRLALVLLAVSLVATACAHKPRASAPAPEPKVSAAPAPTPMPEQVVEPETPAVPSEAVAEELPQDLQELNRRGYLQDVFFATDKYELAPEARQVLATNAAWLQKYPSVTFLVEGHCDERNTREYNLALGERRAGVTRDYLISLGVAAQRIKTVSYGEEKPFAMGHDESTWRLNRRTHFVVTGR
jgi:peptidoglycan-associated lipoprotein